MQLEFNSFQKLRPILKNRKENKQLQDSDEENNLQFQTLSGYNISQEQQQKTNHNKKVIYRDEVEDRINKFFDNLGVYITNPDDKKEYFWSTKRTKISSQLIDIQTERKSKNNRACGSMEVFSSQVKLLNSNEKNKRGEKHRTQQLTLEEIRDELLRSKLISKRNFKNLELDLDHDNDDKPELQQENHHISHNYKQQKMNKFKLKGSFIGNNSQDNILDEIDDF